MEMQADDTPCEHTLSPEWLLCASEDSEVETVSNDTEDHTDGDTEDSWSLSDKEGQEGMQPTQYHQDRRSWIFLAMRCLLTFNELEDQVKRNEALLLNVMERVKQLMMINNIQDSTLTRMFSMEMQGSLEETEQQRSCMTVDSQSSGAPSIDTEDHTEGQVAEAMILEQVLVEDTEDTSPLHNENVTADIKELPDKQGQGDECEQIERSLLMTTQTFC
ncbi:hypothetical protein NL108_008923 [Boleophthalmus pectinirostris]|nr:hypothetical protein NL108_008923 [Boleophthalmus pectinirostris]